MDSPINIEALLTQVALFKGLPSAGLERIARSTRKIYASKGDFLFRKNDICKGFHALLYGQVKLMVTSSLGSEKVVKILHEGEIFGEATMLMETPYVVAAQTLTDCLLLHVGKRVVFAELERNHNLCRKMLSEMALHEQQFVADVESYSLHSGKQRIINYLLSAVANSDADCTSIAVTLLTTKGVVASRLSLTQEHFSRILFDLSKNGLIVVDGRTIHIPSVPNLRKYESECVHN